MDEKILVSLIEASTLVGKETVRELQKLNGEMKGMHSDTSKLLGFFQNGFKKEIVDGVAASKEKLGDKLTRNTIALIALTGAIGTLTTVIIYVMVK